MPRTSLQFHATPHELAQWLDEFFLRYKVSVGVERFSSRESMRLARSDVARIVADQEADRLVLAVADVAVLDPGAGNQCWITFGHLRDQRLSQSALSASWESAESGRAWHAIRRLIVGHTHGGVLSVNPITGERVPFPSFRFSDGTRRLAGEGVTLVPFAGGARLEVPSPA